MPPAKANKPDNLAFSNAKTAIWHYKAGAFSVSRQPSSST